LKAARGNDNKGTKPFARNVKEYGCPLILMALWQQSKMMKYKVGDDIDAVASHSNDRKGKDSGRQ